MEKIATNITIDPQLRKEAIALFSTFGLNLSTAITLLLSQSVRKQRKVKRYDSLDDIMKNNDIK